jgi:hypothetical protein
VVGTVAHCNGNPSAMLGLPDSHIHAAATVTGTPFNAALPDNSSS